MNKKKASELKALQTTLQDKEGELRGLERRKKDIVHEVGEVKQLINNIKQRIDNLESDKAIVSEHAILKYVEGVLGIDLDKVAKKIMNKKDEEMIETLSNCKYSKEGFKAVVRNNTVVTIAVSRKGDKVD